MGCCFYCLCRLFYEAEYVEYYDYHEQGDYYVSAYLVPEGQLAVSAVVGQLCFVLFPALYPGYEQANQYAAQGHQLQVSFGRDKFYFADAYAAVSASAGA